MDFERLHASFFEKHAALRSGERKGRLVRGHAYAEKLFLQLVWMPLFENFDNLHPEYEIYDWNRKSQFLDFAYMTPFGKFGIECDGFQTHVKEMDREKFSYALNRDTFLTALGWKMMHFSFDDIQSRPEICRMLLQMVVGPCMKEVLRLAWMLGRAIRPQDVIQLFDVDFRTARKWLRGLVEKGCLSPMTTGNSVRSYELKEGSWEHL